MSRLILVRHGETLANRTYRYIGLRDDPLTEVGREQAERLAEALSVLAVSAVYSSPLQRAYQTALPIAEKHGLTVQREEALLEGSFGAWEGLSRQEVLARGGEEAQLLHTWEAHPEICPPGGESFTQVQQRVVQFVERIAQGAPEQSVVLASHVGPIKVLLCAALGAPLSTLFHLFLDPATISVVDWRESRPIVRLFNSHAHLGWERGRWMI